MDEISIIAALRKLEEDPALVTDAAYGANSEKWPDNSIPFIDKHLAYLKLHPNTDPHQYIANLKIMLRKSVNR